MVLILPHTLTHSTQEPPSPLIIVTACTLSIHPALRPLMRSYSGQLSGSPGTAGGHSEPRIRSPAGRYLRVALQMLSSSGGSTKGRKDTTGFGSASRWRPGRRPPENLTPAPSSPQGLCPQMRQETAVCHEPVWPQLQSCPQHLHGKYNIAIKNPVSSCDYFFP